MRLYHHPLSSNARRAVMTAAHLGLLDDGKVELSLVDLTKGAQRKPEFLAMNPSGKVPVLDDEGFFLTESHAIQQYLADKTPGQTLFPTELQPRADVTRWLFWSAHQLSPAVGILNWERVVKGFLGQGAPDPTLEKKGETMFGESIRVLEGHLQGKTWITQDRLTLADLAVSAPLVSVESARLPVGDCPRVLAWLARVKELDAWKRVG